VCVVFVCVCVCVLCVCGVCVCVCVWCLCVCVCGVCVDQDRWQADTFPHDSGVYGGFIEWMSDCQRGASDMLSEICALLGYCPTSNGNSLPTLRDRPPVGLPSFTGHFLDFFGA